MIYVHVPFCASHCTYCAFYSELLHRRCAGGSDALFVAALCREIQMEAGFATEGPDTLYFGGGTPSLLETGQIERIVAALRDNALISAPEEFTFEVNPEDIVEKGPEYAEGLLQLGVNRISMGVESFDDGVLQRMGRRHRNAQSVKAYSILREAGFANVSIDLIFGFEKELEEEKLRADFLEFCSGVLPEHISFYQLGVEEGSGLEKMLEKGLWALPDEDECSRRYNAVCSLLRSLGYDHYEISNWAKPGFESRHNSGYWRHVPYLGLGPGAHSLFTGDKMLRRWNRADLGAYLQAAAKGDFSQVREQETLTPEQIMEEKIFLGLRTSGGIPADFPPRERRGKFMSLLESSDEGKRLRIPEDKWFVSDNIIQNLI